MSLKFRLKCQNGCCGKERTSPSLFLLCVLSLLTCFTNHYWMYMQCLPGWHPDSSLINSQDVLLTYCAPEGLTAHVAPELVIVTQKKIHSLFCLNEVISLSQQINPLHLKPVTWPLLLASKTPPFLFYSSCSLNYNADLISSWPLE